MDTVFAFLKEKYLRDELKLTSGQALTLLALLEVPAMDYEMVENLHLYPRSKMANRVLEPLGSEGWIVFHSLPPVNSRSGAPRRAWSLTKRGRKKMLSAVKEAERWASNQLRKGERSGQDLANELFLPA